MEVYAWDLSVRGAHLDASHGFFNGTSVFLCALGQEDRPCRVELVKPQGKALRPAWRVATSLPVAKGEKGAAALYGFGRYWAADYDELIDHPVEMGTFALIEFKARGVPHAIAVTGRTDVDLKRLAADLKPICEWQIDLFGGKAPMDRYVFLVMAVGDGYGGLEHRASTALLCSRDDLPNSNTPSSGPLPEAYVTFLGLCSHEYFHTWNVKRIKPRRLRPLRPHPGGLHPPAVGLRGLHFLLRRPLPGEERRHRQHHLSQPAGQDRQRREKGPGAPPAERGRILPSPPGPSITGRTKTPPTPWSATTPRAPSSPWPWI